MKLMLAIVCSLALFPVGAQAQVPQSKGTASVQLPPAPPPAKPRKGMPVAPAPVPDSAREQVVAAAKVNALDRYIAEQEPAMAAVYDTVRTDIAGHPDEYLLGAVVLEEFVEAPATLTVVLRVDINKARLDRRLKASVSSNATTGPARMLTFVFVAREQASITRFDATVTGRTVATVSGQSNASSSSSASAQLDVRSASKATSATALDASQQERIRGGSVVLKDQEKTTRAGEARAKVAGEASATAENAEQSTATTDVTSVASGSSEQRADEVRWRVSQATEINQVLTGTFADVGYEVIEAEYLEPESKGLLSLEAIRADFGTGDDIKPATLRNTAQGAKLAEVPFVVYGALDVGIGDVDPVSGLPRVSVTVNAKALDVRGRFPRTVSAVGPVQYSGTGENATVAKTNALKVAAREAGKALIAELDAKAQAQR